MKYFIYHIFTKYEKIYPIFVRCKKIAVVCARQQKTVTNISRCVKNTPQQPMCVCVCLVSNKIAVDLGFACCWFFVVFILIKKI